MLDQTIPQDTPPNGHQNGCWELSAGQEYGFSAESAEILLRRTQAFADELAERPNLGLQTAPLREIERLAEIGVMTAVLPASEGGHGLGLEPGTQFILLRLLAAVGGGDLALGRIVDGHVNALLLVFRYATAEQRSSAAEDCRRGRIFGVWNTGQPELMRLVPEGTGYRFQGAKTFATGAAFVTRPIVTAELPGRGWQMTLPHMEVIAPSIDRSFWHPFGMESSESFGIDFTGARVQPDDLIGAPGDFYRDPIFRGGAIRFAAVQAGAVLRLHALFVEWLERTRRHEDPYQLTRLGEIALDAQQAVLWIEKAADVAESNFFSEEPAHAERMVECANMTRLAIERIATSVMQKVASGVGAQGLLQPHRFERLIRDLTMYLRQPAPDQTLASVGRSALAKARVRGQGAAEGFWSRLAQGLWSQPAGGFWSQSMSEQPPNPSKGSLSNEYFQHIYARNPDPWSFQTSAYEEAKYQTTLANIPLPRYRSGLEIGCSIGVLTTLLAARCDKLLGLDVSERALEQARERCARLPNVEFASVRVPEHFPHATFDLIVVSEVAYYWQPEDLRLAVDQIAAHHEPGGHLILVHWTPNVPDYPLSGDEVHEYWLSRPEWRSVTSRREPQFRLDVLERLV